MLHKVFGVPVAVQAMSVVNGRGCGRVWAQRGRWAKRVDLGEGVTGARCICNVTEIIIARARLPQLDTRYIIILQGISMFIIIITSTWAAYETHRRAKLLQSDRQARNLSGYSCSRHDV